MGVTGEERRRNELKREEITNRLSLKKEEWKGIEKKWKSGWNTLSSFDQGSLAAERECV